MKICRWTLVRQSPHALSEQTITCRRARPGALGDRRANPPRKRIDELHEGDRSSMENRGHDPRHVESALFPTQLHAWIVGLLGQCTAFFWAQITIRLFHLVTVANLPDPVQDDLVAHSDPLLDDEEVFRLVLNDDLAPMCDMILVDDVNVPPGVILERCPPRDEMASFNTRLINNVPV